MPNTGEYACTRCSQTGHLNEDGEIVPDNGDHGDCPETGGAHCWVDKHQHGWPTHFS
jgi:hypothetical protein